jgi:DNA-binding NarL/FixJ family response regulator
VSPLDLYSVCIVSQSRFTGELLAAYLRRECNTPCAIASKVSDASPPEWQKDSRQWLLLCDGAGQDSDELLGDLEKAKTHFMHSPILALYNLATDSGLEQEALAMGVRGFFYIGEDPRKLKKAVTALFAGEVWLTRDHMVRCLLDSKPPRNGRSVLPTTRRETEILCLLREGLGNNDIADQLHISYHTVKTHVFRIFKKIGVRNRWEAAAWAEENM